MRVLRPGTSRLTVHRPSRTPRTHDAAEDLQRSRTMLKSRFGSVNELTSRMPAHDRHRYSASAASSSMPSNPGERTVQSLHGAAASSGSSQLVKRVLAGCAMGLGGAAVITWGGWAYLACMEFVVFQATREYFGFVTAVGLREGVQPPPAWATALVTLCTMSLPLYNYVTGGKIAVALALASFVILSVFVTTSSAPKMSTFSSAIFGLLYCGYLPSYWIKMRMLAVPAISAPIAAHWPQYLGGLTHVTVGFVATFTAIACVVAADVGAYFIGKAFGRTPLTKLSPKKTVEGAVGGAVAACVCACFLRLVTGWPFSNVAAVGLGLVVFFASALGDLIESVMKRDAGVKDSGTLIPGHGGILDRFDSYIFTGAVVYFYMKCLPLFGL